LSTFSLPTQGPCAWPKGHESPLAELEGPAHLALSSTFQGAHDALRRRDVPAWLPVIFDTLDLGQGEPEGLVGVAVEGEVAAHEARVRIKGLAIPKVLTLWGSSQSHKGYEMSATIGGSFAAVLCFVTVRVVLSVMGVPPNETGSPGPEHFGPRSNSSPQRVHCAGLKASPPEGALITKVSQRCHSSMVGRRSQSFPLLPSHRGEREAV